MCGRGGGVDIALRRELNYFEVLKHRCNFRKCSEFDSQVLAEGGVIACCGRVAMRYARQLRTKLASDFLPSHGWVTASHGRLSHGPELLKYALPRSRRQS